MVYDYSYDMSAVGGERHVEFFHGTNHELRGSTLYPRGKNGAEGHDWMSSYLNRHSAKGVFSTPHEDGAWGWAHLRSMEAGGRARVHQVALPKTTEKGNETKDEYISSTARVKDTLDTMPGRQGTIPNLNWNQFGSDKARYGTDFNHPTHEQVEASVNPKPKENTSLETLTGEVKKPDLHQGRLF